MKTGLRLWGRGHVACHEVLFGEGKGCGQSGLTGESDYELIRSHTGENTTFPDEPDVPTLLLGVS